ncbi:transglycosylase SLT domain-containing protein [Burkholderiaceae bacterium FT117]|uniref:transglycosylase SLT domain-containing protein n=1 Tax=Zeimonas sediminis TaxID=2944268 RepID=UPI002342EF2F|nr:transglycosylase SLT domain-containing protein [Zeimonas sediminis]MCM5569619.1 transglycosylase SLT domain-containing protein [Zeimonas sediminis]
MQRFLESASTAVLASPTRLLIGAISLLLAAGCSTIAPQASLEADSVAAAAPVQSSVAVEDQAVDERPDATAAQASARVEAEPSLPKWTGRDESLPGSLWDRIRAGFAMPDLDTSLVAEKERFYLQRPDYLQRMFDRGGRYLFHIVEEIEKRGMPTELALLPFVESAMNPVALSHANAAGLWQFIPSTGKAFNLDQNWWVDNRRDVVKSTEAALDYLQKIYEMHGNDWFLALASYNWGEGAVGRAVKRNKARGLPGDYLSLRMPAETRHYVPKLLALKRIVQRADALGVKLPELPNRPYFVTIEKTRPIDLKLAARFAGMSVEEFVALNPAHNRPVISASRNNEIKLPADRVDAFLDAVENHGRSNRVFATWQPYTLQAGETLESLAMRAGISVAELREANDLRPGSRLLPGTRILSPHRQVADETRVENFDGPRVYELVERPAVHHVVRPRETLSSIARRYGTSVASLKQLNGLKSASAPRGARLLVRPASSQTLLTTESGDRRVLAQGEQPRIIRAVVREQAPARAAGSPTPAAEPVAATKLPAGKPAAARKSTQRAAPSPGAARDAAVRNVGSSSKTPVARPASGKRT